MTTVPAVIHALLMEEEQVSLPGLGTLQLLPQPASINSIQGQLAPPAELVTFNNNLVLDDGRILHALAEDPELDEFSARRLLDDYLQRMRENLDAGRSFTIEEVGRFSKPHGDQIVFSPAGGNFSKENYGLPTLAIRPIVRTERQVRAAVDPLLAGNAPGTGPSTAPAAAPPNSILYNAQLRRTLWYVAAALAAVLLLLLTYRLVQTAGSDDTVASDEYLERDDPPPRLPRDRVNVAPGPRPAPRDADELVPAPAPRIDDPAPTPVPPADDPVEVTINVDPTPDEEASLPPAAAPRARGNVALIATGLFGSQRNVEKNLNRIEAAGFETFDRLEGRLTRLGVRLEYDTEEELFTALERIRRLYADSFVMEVNGEARRIE